MPICLFLFLMGALVNLISKSGGTRACGDWSQHIIHGRRASMFVTYYFGMFLFLDDYFNIITNAAITKIVLERSHVSRPKMAYLIHTMASNICTIVPITSWAAVIIGEIESVEFPNPFPSL